MDEGYTQRQWDRVVGIGVVPPEYARKEKSGPRLGCVWRIRKNGYYYRPHAKGYTASPLEAGIWSYEDAIKYLKVCKEVTLVDLYGDKVLTHDDVYGTDSEWPDSDNGDF